MQSVLSILYPAQCIGCGGLVAEDAALCADCWRETPFIHGASCRKCGAPLLGDAPGDATARCDDCLITPRPWAAGGSALIYKGVARRLVMGLKHGDRHDLVRPMARWMAARLPAVPGADTIILPVPIHWRRMVKRRFNQSALLAAELARLTGARHVPDALIRLRHTKPQEGLSVQERFALQAGTISAGTRRARALKDRPVLIVDDVMTSGATLAAATTAAQGAGAARVDVVTLARVVKDF